MLNAVALVILEDFVRPFYVTLKDSTATRITKGLSLLVGCIGFLVVFLIAHVKGILEVDRERNRSQFFHLCVFFNLKRLLTASMELQWVLLWVFLHSECLFHGPIPL